MLRRTLLAIVPRFGKAVVLGGLLVVMLSGCDRGSTASQTPHQPLSLARAETSPPEDAPQDMVTPAEAEAFGSQWRDAIMTRDGVKVGQLLDFKKIFNRSLEGLVDNERFRNGYLKGAGPAATKFVQSVTPYLTREGAYDLVGAVYRDGQSHVVFRLLDDNGRINYHDLHLIREAGIVKADELFIAATGEAFSDTLRTVVGAAAQSQNSFVDRISGQAKAELKRLELQTQISQAIQSGNTEKALQLLDALPEDIKKFKTSMLYRIAATPVEDEAAYLAAVEGYVAEFPEDASVGLISMDVAVMREDPTMLIAAHEAMTQWTGGDPFLDLMIGANLANLGAVDQARAMVADADVDASPLLEAQDYAATVALATNDHDEVLKRLRIMRDRFGLQFGDLHDNEGFETFVQSPQFEQWESEE
ncbi:hypothetical protein [Allorhodopirellula heiligendammensis]|uniref:Uncharacterized protein n=1 Tax=Allorhodopirellula heiligendammensis TaxID=2714739 RepID=A0A5C6BES6_9BACT|nr:hypothetical protein [Allorhodopirellula heiligendammensis]TWU10410.1 hypothetical protein Poly21_43140 [Allorhodopirellula heiligendammensis]